MPGLDGEMVELKVAKAWGLTPYVWRQQSVDDRALMVAFEMYCDTIEGYRMEWRERKEAGKASGKVRGPNPYHTLLRQAGIPVPGEAQEEPQPQMPRRPRPE